MLRPLEDYQYRLTVPAEIIKTRRSRYCAKAGCPTDDCVGCRKRKQQSFQAKLRAELIKK